MMDFEELTPNTREAMWQEVLAEEASLPYRSPKLSVLGQKQWLSHLAVAIESGDEVWLQDALDRPEYWNHEETYQRNGQQFTRRINIRQSSETLATSEFNTWYVRGLSRRFLDEGIETCEVYRAAPPKWSQASCSQHEGLVVDVRDVYDGHRKRYWPDFDPTAFSVPFQPGCHHSIRRIG